MFSERKVQILNGSLMETGSLKSSAMYFSQLSSKTSMRIQNIATVWLGFL